MLQDIPSTNSQSESLWVLLDHGLLQTINHLIGEVQVFHLVWESSHSVTMHSARSANKGEQDARSQKEYRVLMNGKQTQADLKMTGLGKHTEVRTKYVELMTTTRSSQQQADKHRDYTRG